MKLGKPIKYLAVNPTEVVERVKKNIQIEADESVDKLKELSNNEVLSELESLHKNGIEFIDISDLSGAIKGKHNLYTHLELLVKNAEKSVTICTTSKGLVRKVEALKPVLQRLSKKGVQIRIAAPLTKECVNAIKDLKGVAEVKDSGKLTARFVVIDGRDLLFMLMHDDEVHPTYDVGVWVNTQLFANALESMFNLAWKDFEPASKKFKELQ